MYCRETIASCICEPPLKNVLRLRLICILSVTLSASLLWAEPAPDPQHVESIRKKVMQCVDHHRVVVVETYDNRRLQGGVSEVGADLFCTQVFGAGNDTLVRRCKDNQVAVTGHQAGKVDPRGDSDRGSDRWPGSVGRRASRMMERWSYALFSNGNSVQLRCR